ncbi:grpE protein homolog 2, mitochondrial [Callorhinchus milii]|uniref:GrpE-like 2, mitochondrial n=2 Tax=Callorhinchus milii TaxID=7868 RepID=A0A4W3GPP9_CALMI|nr:grpE protein homolog 2, mitochondrial [Callorhinchus milii]|eukprot:gi/632978957/ref/XP_007906201.1/ PREDICTED: grpE protein homolog 2, mitochondrial [Callorhinchus milii]
MATKCISVTRLSSTSFIWASWNSKRGLWSVYGTPVCPSEEGHESEKPAKAKCSAGKPAEINRTASRCPSQKALQLKVNKLENKYQILKENYQKALAHAEDINRRTRKCVEDARVFGIHSFCKDMLAVADLIEKTIVSVSEEELADSNPTMNNLHKGLSLIEGKLWQIFGKHGLEKMNSIGLKYNSAEHEIISRVPSLDALPGTVVTIKQEGYKLHGRTLRSAQVGLAIETQPHVRKDRMGSGAVGSHSVGWRQKR